MTEPNKLTDDDREEVARYIPMLMDPLNDEQKALLAESMVVVYPYKNEVIYEAGDTVDWLYYLVEGSITIFKKNNRGPKRVIRMVSPQSIFGYEAFNDKPYTHTAVASPDTIIAKVPLSVIFHLIWENSNFAMVFIKDLAELLGLSLRHTAILTQKNIRGRLAECILRMKEKYGVEADGTLPIYLSRENLAGMSNMTTSNAIRTLSAFTEEGLVSIIDRRIKILDEEGLRRASELG